MFQERQAPGRGAVMKGKFAKAKDWIVTGAKARPAETRWSLIGAAAGGGSGLLIGGIGVVAMGSGVGIPAAVILALVGGAAGNRYGIAKDRPVQ